MKKIFKLVASAALFAVFVFAATFGKIPSMEIKATKAAAVIKPPENPARSSRIMLRYGMGNPENRLAWLV